MVPWPNGKALLSGSQSGKDCGFESHRDRGDDVLLFGTSVGCWTAADIISRKRNRKLLEMGYERSCFYILGAEGKGA